MTFTRPESKGLRRALPSGLAILALALAPSTAWPQWQTNGTSVYYNNGNVGIGTSTPAYFLDVYNTISTRGPSGGLVVWPRNGSGNAYVLYTPTGSEFRLYSGSYGDVLSATSSGNVGIGTTVPQYKLAVNGTIGAKEVIVTNSGWPDYVFRPGYRLAPLRDVAAYIQVHRHLPGIPTEAEVRAKGVGVGEMQAKLLEKIEELTLHMIASERRNRELEERVASLEAAAAQKAGKQD